MTIELTAVSLNRAGLPRMDEPPAHLEPSGAMRRVDETIAANTTLLDRFNEQQKSALEWKTLWLCEVMRGDHEFEETYGIHELDRARQKLAFWDKRIEKNGDITAEYQS